MTDLVGMPFDLAEAGGVPDPGPDSREARLLGASAASVPDLARQASPVAHVRADAPPVLLMHGTADDLVPGASHFWKGAGDVAAIIARSVEFLRGPSANGL